MSIKEKTHNECGNNRYASQADMLYIHKINIKSIARSGSKSKYFSKVLTATKKYVDALKQFDGAITPDCTMLIGQSKCLLETNTYFNRAVGLYLQKQGIPVIPNIRWSDERSYDFCFLGVPKNNIVAVSTHGCIRSREQKRFFKAGLEEMLKRLEPSAVIVHGYMPEEVFGEFHKQVPFYRYPSLFEQTHIKEAI